jgi:hypothetical protein
MRHYRETTGITEVDMGEVVKFAVAQGWPLPKPESPLDRLAKEFREAAREEIRHDQSTGRPYRANHSITQQLVQLTLDADHWNGIHPDEEPIDIPADLTDDVQWRLNGPDEMQKAS